MTTRQQWTVVGAIVAGLALAVLAATHFMHDQLFPVDVGTRAPNFSARLVGSRDLKQLTDYKGAVLLNFWATYCEPCREEMPSLERLHKEYGPRGLRIVAVSEDNGVSDDSIRAFAKTYGITFELLVDSAHVLPQIYQTTGYPETFVIGPEGVIRRKWIGPADWTSQGNRALVAQLLGLAPPSVVGTK